MLKTSFMVGWLVLANTAAIAGNSKFMSIKAAKMVAERAIVESVIGLKVRSTSSVVDMVAQDYRIEAKTMAKIRGIEYIDTVYDPQRNIAKVTAVLQVGKVENIIGKRINYGNQIIKRVGFGTSDPRMVGPLKALRAAELDAYAQLARKIVGFKLKSGSLVENYILKSDEIKTKMMAAIYGAELVAYRWDEQGDAYVKLALKLDKVEDVLGQRIQYDRRIVEVEGNGAQHDDFSESRQQRYQEEPQYRQDASTIREGSLNIPMPVPNRQPLVGEGMDDRYQQRESFDAGGAVNLQ